MVCLTSDEASRWIENHGYVEDPYLNDPQDQPPFRIQIEAPETYRGVECFVGSLIDEVVGSGGALLVLTDCNPSRPSQDFIHDCLRKSVGETRSIPDASAYLVTEERLEQAVGVFALFASFGWKCYLYCAETPVTLYCWEGEILDIWTSSSPCLEMVRRIVRELKLREI